MLFKKKTPWVSSPLALQQVPVTQRKEFQYVISKLYVVTGAHIDTVLLGQWQII